MPKPALMKFQQLAPLLIQKYERYLPNAFDESMTLLQKVNMVVEHGNNIGRITNEVVEQWNQVAEWIMNDGLDEGIDVKVSDMVERGVFHRMINEDIFGEIHKDIADHDRVLETKITKGTVQKTDYDLSKNANLWNMNDFDEATRAVLMGMEPGQVNAVLGKGNVHNEHLADKIVTFEKLQFAKVGQNKFNKDTVTKGYYISHIDGTLEKLDRYETSDYIPIQAGKTYTISAGRKVVTFNSSKEYLSGHDGTNLAYTFTATTNGYVRFSYDTAYQAGSTVQLVEGETLPPYRPYESYFENVGLNEAQKRQVNESLSDIKAEQTDFAELNYGKNLFNKNDIVVNQFLENGNKNGTIPLDGYFTTTTPIELRAGRQYVVNRVRFWKLFDRWGVMLDQMNTGNNAASAKFSPTQDSYLWFSGGIQYLDVTQVEEGTAATEYEPYSGKSLIIEDLKLTAKQIEQIKKNDVISGDTVNVKIKNDETSIISKFSEEENIEIMTNKYGSANGTFNLLRTIVGGKTIHTNGDDITPIRTFTTVGANHGYTNIVKITQSGHGKTTADLGSTWTDGTNNYTLLRVDGNVLTIGYPYTVQENGNVISASAVPKQSLTHVSGATNTASIPITGLATGQQLYPSVNRVDVKYLLDGDEIKEDGDYTGKEFSVVESYFIMDYKSIVDNAQSNIGTPFWETDVEGLVKISNTYTFKPGGKCTTSHSIRALKPVQLGRCGFLQSIHLSLSGYKTIRYVPGVKEKNGYDFKNGVDLANFSTSTVFEQTDNVSVGEPPNTYVDWLTLNGEKRYGFSMGYVPDKTDSSNVERSNNVNATWDFRNTKKSYPVALDGVFMNPGEYYSFEGFRNYLNPNEVGKVSNLNVVEDKRDVYVYIHANHAENGLNRKLTDHIGKTIELIESDGVALKNEVVDTEGIVFNTTGTYSKAVARIR